MPDIILLHYVSVFVGHKCPTYFGVQTASASNLKKNPPAVWPGAFHGAVCVRGVRFCLFLSVGVFNSVTIIAKCRLKFFRRPVTAKTEKRHQKPVEAGGAVLKRKKIWGTIFR